MKKNYILMFSIIACIYGCSGKKVKQVNFYVHDYTCVQKPETITIKDAGRIKALQTLFDGKKQEPGDANFTRTLS